jgi:hypothetical protein
MDRGKPYLCGHTALARCDGLVFRERVGLARDVTREIFTLDPTILSTQAMGLKVGIIEITVRDSGAIDRFLAQLAKDRNLSPDDARRSLLIDMDQAAQPLLSANPELRSVLSTAVKFMETSKGDVFGKGNTQRQDSDHKFDRRHARRSVHYAVILQDRRDGEPLSVQSISNRFRGRRSRNLGLNILEAKNHVEARHLVPEPTRPPRLLYAR